MGNSDLNGKTSEIHENVIYLKNRFSSLERSIDGLANNIQHLTIALENNNTSNERVITRMSESLPIKFVCLICMIICVAFIGGGLLKELIDSHILVKLLGG